MTLTIQGLQEVQEWNARAIANMRPSGTMGRMIQIVVSQIQRAEIAITHVDTGALRASERMEVNGLRGRTYIDPNALNPQSLELTSVYAVIENARGDPHNFAERTFNVATPQIVTQALSYLGGSLV